jgi:cyclic beta-1,2-glucan synthetase
MFGRGAPESPWDDPKVIREAIFSSERLEKHAQGLAAAQVVRPHRQKGRPLLDRLADNETSLVLSYQAICGAVAVGASITPAAEWLIDNFTR